MAWFTCPGLAMPQPADAPDEGYVGCYLAGHKCHITTEHIEDDWGVTTRSFCHCCGTPYGSMAMPWSMVHEKADADEDDNRRARARKVREIKRGGW